MKTTLFSVTLLLALLLTATSHLLAQESVTEPSTGKIFPAEVKVQYGGTDYVLKVTGVAVRKKVVFKVYGMAHYMQDPAKGSSREAFAALLSEGKAKQIVMDFARDVDVGKIQDAYKDGFKEHASAEELKQIQPLIDRFIGYITKDIKVNDRYVLRWFPTGTVVAVLQGEEKPAIVNETFARTLWSIWLGEDSIVDRDALIARIVSN